MGDIFRHEIQINNKFVAPILNKKSNQFSNASELAKWLYQNKHTTQQSGFACIEKVSTPTPSITLAEVFEYIYPVYSIYITYDKNANPNTLFGIGNWQRLGGGRALWVANPNTFIEDERYLNAGLPNITGSFWHTNLPTANSGAGGGAISYVDGGSATYTGFSSNKRNDVRWNFNASASNSIYGNSSTVQPPAVQVFVWQRVA